MGFVCCVTGHRPEKIKTCETQIKEALQKEIQRAIADGFTVFISGMARGVDLWAAQLVLNFKKENPNITLICAIPYDGFERNWSPSWRQCYRYVLDAADYVKVFCSSFDYTSFQTRNCWMVDHCTRVLAVYNGEYGGTRNTIQYAKQKKVNVRIIAGESFFHHRFPVKPEGCHNCKHFINIWRGVAYNHATPRGFRTISEKGLPLSKDRKCYNVYKKDMRVCRFGSCLRQPKQKPAGLLRSADTGKQPLQKLDCHN